MQKICELVLYDLRIPSLRPLTVVLGPNITAVQCLRPVQAVSTRPPRYYGPGEQFMVLN